MVVCVQVAPDHLRHSLPKQTGPSGWKGFGRKVKNWRVLSWVCQIHDTRRWWANIYAFCIFVNNSDVLKECFHLNPLKKSWISLGRLWIHFTGVHVTVFVYLKILNSCYWIFLKLARKYKSNIQRYELYVRDVTIRFFHHPFLHQLVWFDPIWAQVNPVKILFLSQYYRYFL